MFDGINPFRAEKVIGKLHETLCSGELRGKLALLHSEVDFSERLKALDDELVDNGFRVTILVDSQFSSALGDLLVSHGLVCGRIYLSYSYDLLTKLKKDKRGRIRGKDDVFKMIEPKAFEKEMDKAWDYKDFTAVYDLNNLMFKGAGLSKNLRSLPKFNNLLLLNGSRCATVYFDNAMKLFDLIKRRVR